MPVLVVSAVLIVIGLALGTVLSHEWESNRASPGSAMSRTIGAIPLWPIVVLILLFVTVGVLRRTQEEDVLFAIFMTSFGAMTAFLLRRAIQQQHDGEVLVDLGVPPLQWFLIVIVGVQCLIQLDSVAAIFAGDAGRVDVASVLFYGSWLAVTVGFGGPKQRLTTNGILEANGLTRWNQITEYLWAGSNAGPLTFRSTRRTLFGESKPKIEVSAANQSVVQEVLDHYLPSRAAAATVNMGAKSGEPGSGNGVVPA